MTENEDCRRSGRDRRISSKLAAFFETENAFKKVRSPPSAERPAKAKNPTPTQPKPKNATPVVPKPKNTVPAASKVQNLTPAVAKIQNPTPAAAKVQNPTPTAAKPKPITPAKPKPKREQVSLLSVAAVKPQLSRLLAPVLPPALPEPDLAEHCEPATSSSSSIENVTPDNTPLSLSRPKREHRSSRRAIEAMESLSPTKKKQPVARVYESLQQPQHPQQIQIDTVTQPSPSIVEYHDVLNENELIHADSEAAPRPKKRKISDSTRVSRNGVKIGRPSKEELQEYREFVIARGGDPDAPIPPKWRHEMLEAANKEAQIETPRFRRRKSPKRFSPVENAVHSPGIHALEPTSTSSTPVVRDPRANLKVALNLPTYTPPAVGESRTPVVLPSAARLSAPHRGAPAKFVNYGNKRRVAVPAQRTYISPLVTNSTTVTTSTQPRTIVQARPPPVIRFLKPNSTPSSILRATKPKPAPPAVTEPNVAKPLTVDVTYPEPAPPSTSEETHNFKGGYVTFPECADDRFTGVPRMYIPLEENIEYVLVNQNGELMCNEYTPPQTPEEAYPPQKIHAIFEVQPDCTLTVL